MFTKLSSLMWITYCSYYFCRVNFSAVQPSLMVDQGWSKTQVGLISSALLAMYAIGQFANGYLADRFGPKRLLLAGMSATAVANVSMGLAGSLWLMVAIWGINGFCQATGWPASIKILGEHHARDERGAIMGWWGTCYQAGTFITWILTGFVVARCGWRYGFWVPALLVAATSVAFASAFPRVLPLKVQGDPGEGNPRIPLGAAFRKILGSPELRWVAAAYACLGYLRYGFINWGILMLMERQKIGLSSSAIKMSMLPLAGAVGAVLAGWSSDRFFRSKRFPISAISFCGLVVLLLTLLYFGDGGGLALVALIGGIGLLINGADLILGGAAAQDLSPKGLMAVSAGFIDGMMYIGAVFSGFFTGMLVDALGWAGALVSWTAAAAVGGGISLYLCNRDQHVFRSEP